MVLLERRLKFLFFPLALMAIGSLALIPGVAPAYIGAFVLILLPGFFLNPKSEPFSGYSIAWHVAVVVFLLWTTGHLLLTGHGLHVTLSYQLSFVILYRMLTPKKPRHYQEIWYWCLSSLILAGFWTNSILFIAVVAAFTVLSVFAFVHAAALREQERQTLARAGDDGEEDESIVETPGGRMRRRRFAGPVYLGAMAMVILAVAMAVFVALPRRGITTLSVAGESALGERDVILTGLSEYISLGSLGKILQDNTEAFRLTVDQPALDAGGLYLRGGVLDVFNGQLWQISPYLSRSLNASGARAGPGRATTTLTGGDPALPGQRIEQKIVYTGLATNTVFAMPNVARLYLDKPAQFSVSPAGVITLRSPERQFEAVSYPWNPHRPMEMPIVAPLFAGAALKADTAEANPLYLQIPEALQTLTFQHFVNRVTADAPSDTAKAVIIERWLEKNCGYTLDLRSYRSNNPVEEFLFDRREGHCEFFATAMVMMLRSAGVPARLVSGFRGGVAAPDGGAGHFIVRNRDVHTWVEAWTPETGWRQFDPTPPAPMEVMGGSLAFLTMRQWAEALQRKANHFVFSFNRDQQASMLASLRQVVSPWFVMLWTLERKGLLPWVMIAPAAAMAWLLVWLGRRWLRRDRRPQARRAGTRPMRLSHSDAVFLAWARRRLLAILGGSERAMDHDHTLREEALALAARREDAVAGEVRSLTDDYYAMRFGARPLTPAARDEMRRRLERLQASVR